MSRMTGPSTPTRGGHSKTIVFWHHNRRKGEGYNACSLTCVQVSAGRSYAAFLRNTRKPGAAIKLLMILDRSPSTGPR